MHGLLEPRDGATEVFQPVRKAPDASLFNKPANCKSLPFVIQACS